VQIGLSKYQKIGVIIMTQLPKTYEEFLALPAEDRDRLHQFCTRHNVQQIASIPYDDQWDEE
jgi:hypothetical protein